MGSDLVTFKLKKNFVELIDEIIESKYNRYSNRAEVIKDAVRELHHKVFPKNEKSSDNETS